MIKWLSFLIMNTMKMNYDKAIQVNNELKVNIDNLLVDMKHLKEQCDIDDEDKVQKTTVARTPMKKSKVCVCNMLSNICNKILTKKTYLERAHKAL